MAKEEHVAVSPITIETVDRAVRDWFDLTVDVHVESPNSDRKKVPVVFSSGERFATSRERKGIRDTNGVLILPIISVRRTGIDPEQNMQALGVMTPRLSFARQISGKTNNLQNLNQLRDPSRRMKDPVVFEVTSVPYPYRSIMMYELVIQTQYMTQMNSVLEKMFHGLDIQRSFVAPFDVHKRHAQVGVDFEARKPLKSGYVVGFFDAASTDTGNLEEFTDQERIVKYTTTLRVPTTLQLDPEGEKPSVSVEQTSFGLDFGDERVCFVDDVELLEKIFGK